MCDHGQASNQGYPKAGPVILIPSQSQSTPDCPLFSIQRPSAPHRPPPLPTIFLTASCLFSSHPSSCCCFVVFMLTCVYQEAWRPEEGIESHGAGVTGNWSAPRSRSHLACNFTHVSLTVCALLVGGSCPRRSPQPHTLSTVEGGNPPSAPASFGQPAPQDTRPGVEPGTE